MYAEFVNQTNLSYSNEVTSAKHVQSYGKAGRVDSISLIFHTLWFKDAFLFRALDIQWYLFIG